MEKIFIFLTAFVFTIEILLFITFVSECKEKEEIKKINISNTPCTISKHIGRKIFLHICKKNEEVVYDIRYFWSNESQTLKPEIIGVQLTEREFQNVCKFC